MKSAPHLDSPAGATSKGRGAATLPSSTSIAGEGHHGGTSCSSSGVFIKENEQKTIAGSVTRKPHFSVRVKEKWGMELLGPGKGWGLKIRTKEKYFIMLMKKREN